MQEGGGVKPGTDDEPHRAAIVAGATQPKQAGDIRDRWPWIEHSVWTERMLTRLEQSEPTTVWFGLWDKVTAERNLQAAFWAVWRNAGEQRPLGIPAVRDRTVEAAMKQVLEPIFEHDFAEHSYGFRPGRGCRQAVQRVEELLSQGNHWCVDLDFKSYFDTIPHEQLLELVKRRVVDGSVLALLAGVLEELKGWEPTERGTPQGAVISPLLANLYLNPLDQQMAAAGWQMVRYADDLVVLCGRKRKRSARWRDCGNGRNKPN